jgi:diguanylate cyclase (GGDEF)-like protein/PAS domain S-box-containing protein
VDLVAHVDDRVHATAAPKQLWGTNLGSTQQRRSRVQAADGGHPWHRWDDGRLWRGVYYVRSMMLIAFAAASWLSGAHEVAYVVIVLILPFNILIGLQHRRRGDASWLLGADQYLAGACAIINPIVVVGVVVCQLVGAVTGAMGLRQRVVQPSIGAGGALLFAAGAIHHDRTILAFSIPVTLSTMAIARAIVYLKQRNLTANRRYEELLDGINAYVFETDFHSGAMLYMNRRTRQMVGADARSDQPLLDLVHPDDRHLAAETASTARKTGRPVTTEVRVLSGEDICYVEMRTTVSTKGTRRRVRTVLIDVSDRKRAELELAHRAVHDPLTDLPNRALLRERLESALCPTADTGTPNSLLLLDLNNFKRVNDALGHASGDHLLVELANRLQRIADPDDTVARLGGDEFAVLMPRADSGHALEFAHRCAVILSAPWKERGVTINPRVSIGIALAEGAADGETLLREADTAMYECKRRGADYVVYDAGLERLNIERLRLLSDPIAQPLRNRISDRLPADLDLGGSELVEEAE